jgi:hypothetical protein
MLFPQDRLKPDSAICLIFKAHQEIWDLWQTTVDQAFEINELTPDDLTERPLELIYEELLLSDAIIDQDVEPKILREITYKGQVIARLTRTGTLFKTEALFLKENAP